MKNIIRLLLSVLLFVQVHAEIIVVNSQDLFNDFNDLNPTVVDLDAIEGEGTDFNIDISDLDTNGATFTSSDGQLRIIEGVRPRKIGVVGGFVRVDFAAPVTGFGMILTAPDDTNTIEFFDDQGTSLALINADPNGADLFDFGNPDPFTEFFLGAIDLDGISSVVVSGPALEVHDFQFTEVAASVPVSCNHFFDPNLCTRF